MDIGTLDDALVKAGELRDELNSITTLPAITYGQASLIARAIDHAEQALDRIAGAIALDDALYPEEVNP